MGGSGTNSGEGNGEGNGVGCRVSGCDELFLTRQKVGGKDVTGSAGGTRRGVGAQAGKRVAGLRRDPCAAPQSTYSRLSGAPRQPNWNCWLEPSRISQLFASALQ